MTNEEAITILEELASCCEYDIILDSEDVEALNKAIEALKNERPQGEWIKESKLYGGFGDCVLVNTCSICGESFIYHEYNPKFCSDCGAVMRGDGYDV